MTLLLDVDGWIVDLRPVARRPAKRGLQGGTEMGAGHAIAMTFDGATKAHGPHGEGPLPGHHNYFLGPDSNAWRTGVPIYSSVLYEGMYPGIDVRVRQANGVPEYDLLLGVGADLASVCVCVSGAHGLTLRGDGALVIETSLGPLVQPVPKTWEIGANGKPRAVPCQYRLLGRGRFGFEAPGWDRSKPLTIDPGLIWSTFIGGTARDFVLSLAKDNKGVVTVVGETESVDYPTSLGAYRNAFFQATEAFVTSLDPSKTGSAQLVFSTFLGGGARDIAFSVHVGATGLITVAGGTSSASFPTTPGAYDRSFNGGEYDTFVARLDPGRSGIGQLVWSTLCGGNGSDWPWHLTVDTRGVVTLSGQTGSTDHPTTRNAYDTSLGGTTDAIVCSLDPAKTGAAQLVFSTYLGGLSEDYARCHEVGSNGIVTVGGGTSSSKFPTTKGAHTIIGGGAEDGFVSQLDPSRVGAAQLAYSTFLGGSKNDRVSAIHVGPKGRLTVAGTTESPTFPTSTNAFAGKHGGDIDTFVCQVDVSKVGKNQLTWSTFVGGWSTEYVAAVHVDAKGLVTVAGSSGSRHFPTTPGAFVTVVNGYVPFATRLDPSLNGKAQLQYSTALSGVGEAYASDMIVEDDGSVLVAGYVWGGEIPTAPGAYDRSRGGFVDGFVTHLRMKPFWAVADHGKSCGQEIQAELVADQVLRIELSGTPYRPFDHAILLFGTRLTQAQIPGTTCNLYTQPLTAVLGKRGMGGFAWFNIPRPPGTFNFILQGFAVSPTLPTATITGSKALLFSFR